MPDLDFEDVQALAVPIALNGMWHAEEAVFGRKEIRAIYRAFGGFFSVKSGHLKQIAEPQQVLTIYKRVRVTIGQVPEDEHYEVDVLFEENPPHGFETFGGMKVTKKSGLGPTPWVVEINKHHGLRIRSHTTLNSI